MKINHSLEQRMKNDLDLTVGPDGVQLSQREIIRLQRKRMRDMVMQRLRAANKILNYNDIVQEDPMPDFGSFMASIGKFFEARRPLRPERKERHRHLNVNITEPKIVVSIRSAQNLPTRDIRLDEEVRPRFFLTRRWPDCARRSANAILVRNS